LRRLVIISVSAATLVVGLLVLGYSVGAALGNAFWDNDLVGAFVGTNVALLFGLALVLMTGGDEERVRSKPPMLGVAALVFSALVAGAMVVVMSDYWSAVERVVLLKLRIAMGI